MIQITLNASRMVGTDSAIASTSEKLLVVYCSKADLNSQRRELLTESSNWACQLGICHKANTAVRLVVFSRHPGLILLG